METQSLEQQIQVLNNKMDRLLDHVHEQRLRTQSLEDLIADLSIVGKDAYDSAVAELDKQSVELDPSQLSLLAAKLLKNLPNFAIALDAFESVMDLTKDVGPIVNETIIELTHKLHEMEQKGYFEFFSSTVGILDNVVSHFSKEDVQSLADNVVPIMETVKSLTQPEMMTAFKNAIQVFNSIEQDNIPSYSIFKLIREMNQPEMKRAMGFAVMFLKNLSQSQISQSNTK
jgi:uncharacterized protein YjgD (DUF1641 family)